MDYSYLNQSFDPTCSLSGSMETIPSCQLTCSGYPDPLSGSACTGQLGPPGYSRYGPGGHVGGPGSAGMPSTMRSTNHGIGHAGANGASMISAAAAAGRMNAANVAAARVHAESMQSSMFQTGIGLQSKPN